MKNWYEKLTLEQNTILLSTVLPKLNKYLQTANNLTDLNDEIFLPTVKTLKMKKITNKRIVLKTEPELLQFQEKILRFLGNLPPELRKFILNTQTQSITFPTNLPYILNFESENAIIYLNKLLPRIVELSMIASDRPLRIAACESLHTITVYLIGKFNQENMKSFEILYHPLIMLACDSDPMISKLFDTLIKQIIHWITSPVQNIDSTELIRTVMDLLVHSSNIHTRLYAAECLHELTNWSIKQQEQIDGRIDLQNIQKILDIIVMFATNPDPEKRYGSALAFNQIIRILAANNEIIDIFWIQLMYSFVKCLEFDNNSVLNSVEQTCKVLDVILKVMIQKNSMFNSSSSMRIKPQPMEGE